MDQRRVCRHVALAGAERLRWYRYWIRFVETAPCTRIVHFFLMIVSLSRRNCVGVGTYCYHGEAFSVLWRQDVSRGVI